MNRITAALAFSLALFLPEAGLAATFLQIVSQGGDPVGQGQLRTITPADSTFSVSEYVVSSGTYGTQIMVPGGGNWTLLFMPPNYSMLSAGTYTGVANYYGTPYYPNQSSTPPTMAISGNGVGCNTLTGQFTVLEFVTNGTQVARLAIDFEQHCDGIPAALYGGIRYNSDIAYNAPPQPPPAAAQLAFVGPSYPHYTIHHGESTPPLQMKALDGHGNPAVNATVVFTVAGNCGGSFAGASSYQAITGADGIASTIPFNAGTGSGWCIIGVTSPGVRIDIPLSFAVAVYEVSDLSVGPGSVGHVYPHVNSTFTVSAEVVFQGTPFLGYSADWSVVPAANGASATLLGKSNAAGFDIATFSANGMGGDYKIVARIGNSSTEIPVSQRGDPASLDYPTDFTMPPSSSAQYEGRVLDQFGLGVRGLLGLTQWLCNASSSCATAQGTTTDDDGRFVVTVNANGVPGDFQVHSAFAGGAVDRTVTIHLVPGASTPIVAVPLVQDMWWSGSPENGWGMSIVQHGEKLFAVVYAYDASGKPTWYVMPAGSWSSGRNIYTGSLYLPSGSPFYAYDTSRFVPGPAVGAMSIDFSGSIASMDYNIGGQLGHKNVTRQPFGSAISPPQSGLGDMWWGGTAQNGWGIAILQQNANLFSVWFTYDANGAPTWYVMPAGTWSDASTYEGRMYRTIGSAWVGQPYNATQLQVFDVGPFRLRFSAGAATLDYTIDSRTGTLQLSRQGF